MKQYLILFGLLAGAEANAQRTIDVSKNDVNLSQNAFYSVGGTPFVNTKFVRLVDGTPYFRDEWMRATLVAPSGQEFKDISVKLDLFDNEIHYLDKNGQELIATTPIKEVVLSDEKGGNYRFVLASSVSGEAKAGWYQALTSGDASLFKDFQKRINERKPYGQATVEQYILTNESYLVKYNNTLLEIKKIKDAPSVLANKKSELQEYLKTERPGTNDSRFIALIDYYNSLLKADKK